MRDVSEVNRSLNQAASQSPEAMVLRVWRIWGLVEVFTQFVFVLATAAWLHYHFCSQPLWAVAVTVDSVLFISISCCVGSYERAASGNLQQRHPRKYARYRDRQVLSVCFLLGSLVMCYIMPILNHH